MLAETGGKTPIAIDDRFGPRIEQNYSAPSYVAPGSGKRLRTRVDTHDGGVELQGMDLDTEGGCEKLALRCLGAHAAADQPLELVAANKR